MLNTGRHALFAFLVCLPLVAGCSNYSLRTETTNFTRNQDGSGSQTIYIDRDEGFDVPVNLSLSGEPAGVTSVFEPAPAGGDHAILWLGIGSSTPTGDHTLTVTGDADGETQTVDVPLSVLGADTEDFGIDVSPLTADGAPGDSLGFEVDLQWAGGFADDADLECQGAPSGVTCSFSENPAPVNTDSVDLTIDLDSSVSDGEYPILVNGTAGTQMKATSLLLTVDSGAPAVGSYTLRSEVTNFTLNQEQNGSVILYIDRLNGHAAPVDLTAPGAPADVTISFEPNPSSVDSAIVSIEVGASAAVSDYTITVDGDDSAGTDSTTFPITVNSVDLEDFALSVTALSVDVTAGSTGTVDVLVDRTGGFSDEVALNCDAEVGITCAFATDPVPVASAETSLTLSVDAAMASGTYPVLIDGSGGTQSKMTALHVVVP